MDVVRFAALCERRRPSEVKGMEKASPIRIQIYRKIRENFHVPQWRYSDEENFEDLRKRAVEVLDYMESHGAERIIAVTHGVMIRIIIACAIHGYELTGAECEGFIRGFRMQRAGIVALSVNRNLEEEGIASKFQLWMWNDYSHLI
jgi:broad specificity phosphatase PhoE